MGPGLRPGLSLSIEEPASRQLPTCGPHPANWWGQPCLSVRGPQSFAELSPAPQRPGARGGCRGGRRGLRPSSSRSRRCPGSRKDRSGYLFTCIEFAASLSGSLESLLSQEFRVLMAVELQPQVPSRTLQQENKCPQQIGCASTNMLLVVAPCRGD